jgi:hypothetical protein
VMIFNGLLLGENLMFSLPPPIVGGT